MLDVLSICKKYPKSIYPNVDNISFKINDHEVVGLVGESGCGKTTVTNLILKLTRLSSGKIRFMDKNIYNLSKDDEKKFRKNIRKIFQNPDASLNPGMQIKEILDEVFKKHGPKNNNIDYSGLLTPLGLDETVLNKYPHELSSGQKKRIGIARAFIVPPKLLLADEPFTGIDQTQVVQIFKFMTDQIAKHNIAVLFISHDLEIVRYFSDRILVMHNGVILEELNRVQDFSYKHPYTHRLFNAHNYVKKG